MVLSLKKISQRHTGESTHHNTNRTRDLKQGLPIVEQINIEYFGALKEQASVFIELLHS